jgi:hypothetical protein
VSQNSIFPLFPQCLLTGIIDPIGLIFRIFKTLFDGSKGLNIRFIAVLLAIGPRPESVSNSEG